MMRVMRVRLFGVSVMTGLNSRHSLGGVARVFKMLSDIQAAPIYCFVERCAVDRTFAAGVVITRLHPLLPIFRGANKHNIVRELAGSKMYVVTQQIAKIINEV